MTEFRHPETGERIVGDPAALRKKYLARLAEHQAQVALACKQSQTDYLTFTNADDLNRLLSLHFIRRRMW